MKTRTLFVAFLLLSYGEVTAQEAGTTAAIMRVQVEIIGGAQFDQQLVDAGASDVYRMDRGEQVSLGEFSITVPEGADYSIHVDREIEMHGADDWIIESSAETQLNGRQKRFFLKGRRAQQEEMVAYWGAYEGRQVAVLEFH